jgi:hypothetical protein
MLALGAASAEPIPLLYQRTHVIFDVGLEFQDAFLREDVGDDLALARVRDAVPGVK